jgi:hypothetical protein
MAQTASAAMTVQITHKPPLKKRSVNMTHLSQVDLEKQYITRLTWSLRAKN